MRGPGCSFLVFLQDGGLKMTLSLIDFWQWWSVSLKGGDEVWQLIWFAE
jgi:hypothetical protein